MLIDTTIKLLLKKRHTRQTKDDAAKIKIKRTIATISRFICFLAKVTSYLYHGLPARVTTVSKIEEYKFYSFKIVFLKCSKIHQKQKNQLFQQINVITAPARGHIVLVATTVASLRGRPPGCHHFGVTPYYDVKP